MKRIFTAAILIAITFSAMSQNLLSEGFESGIFPPEGWTLQSAGAGFALSSVSAAGASHSGNHSAVHKDDVGPQDDLLITPELTIGPDSDCNLIFWQYGWWLNYVYEGFHQILITENGDDWAVIYEGYPPGGDNGAGGIWENVILPLDAYRGKTVKIAFRYVGNYEDLWYIDDVSVRVDTYPPVVIKLRGNTVSVGSDILLELTLEDESGIASCTGFYSRDGFITTEEIPMAEQKIYRSVFCGTIDAEQEEILDGEVYFYITDTEGNGATTEKYKAHWLATPVSFDLRNYNGINFVTSVKSQQGGTCWTHGAMAAMESNLMMTGYWELYEGAGEPDLAEYHLDWWNGFNEFNNDDILPDTGEGLEVHMGGDYLVTAAYLSRGEGAVRNIDGQSYDTPPDRFVPLSGSGWYKKFIPYNIEWLTISEDLNGIETIKKKIMEHGAIGTCMMYSSAFIKDYIHYQPMADDQEPNHAVAIIGWNNDKETQAPEGPGAWLVKNSWGTGWGNGGYFWISYYDKHCCKHPEMGAISFQDVRDFDSTTNRNYVLYHDYHGWRDTMEGCTEAFNKFYMGRWLSIDKVSFFTAADSVDFTITVYDTFEEGELKGVLGTVSGSAERTGFHTAQLGYNSGDYDPGDIYVYLYLSKGGQPYDRTSEIPVLLGSKAKALVRSSAERDQSYFKADGSWKDMQDYAGDDYPGTSNFCIKAMMTSPCAIDEVCLPETTQLHQNYPNPFNPETVITFSLEKNSEIRLSVYNMKGERVAVLAEGAHKAGIHKTSFNSEGLTSGIYYYSLEINGKAAAVKKMVLVR
jgi:C1A family cysteine protease